MTMTDPIADMLARIRNGLRDKRNRVAVPRSKIKLGILKVLEKEGYIRGFSESAEGPQGAIQVDLKYGPDGEEVITNLKRCSTPGRRLYTGIDGLTPVLNGLGIAVLSTSRGIVSDREARKLKVGGEVLCEVW